MGALKLDSETQSLEEQLAVARTLPAGDLLEAVYNYNWDEEAVEVLGAIADRPDCTLFTALQIFHGAEPDYYEGPKEPWDVPMFDLLTRIHDRINASGYRHDPADHHKPRTFNKEWFLGTQDGNESRKVRHWQLDPRIVLPACERPPVDPNGRPALSERDEVRAQDLFVDLSGQDKAKQRMAAMALVMASTPVQWRVGKLMEVMPKKSKFEIRGFLRELLNRKK